ncbi:MAG TPA: ABC transporter ATP-binding protein [Acidimicrobiia bacterium]
MMAVLSIREVTKTYPGSPPIEALRGVDLEVDDGGLVAVVGPSGSGKSTLLHLMGTLDQPSTGSVHVAGFDTGQLSDRQLSGLRANSVGFVFQQFHLLAGATTLENVAEGALYTGLTEKERQQGAAAAIERVGLEQRVHHRAGLLSGGEQQRVAIARALMGDPVLLLADEPTGNLDTRTGAAVIDLLMDLNAQGVAVVVITHEHEVADRFPRTISIRDGLVESDSNK